MLEYDELGEMIDLFVMLSWTGVVSGDGLAPPGVSAIPTGKQYHAGGMDLKCERVHERLDFIARQLEQVRRSNMNWLEKNIGTN